MNEEEWHSCTDPWYLLNHLSTGERHRKDRLFLVACCRGLWHLFADPVVREAVELAERHADGEVSRDHLHAVRERLDSLPLKSHDALDLVDAATWVWPAQELDPFMGCGMRRPPRLRGFGHRRGEGLDVCMGGLFARTAVCGAHSDRAVEERAEKEQVALIRCVYGNPFRPATPLALLSDGGLLAGLAQAAYDERELPPGHLDNARLAVLSDALEEAGCTDTDLLTHLRSAGPHVRGCWAVDLVLRTAGVPAQTV